MILTRLLYAHRLLLDPGHTVEDVALKLGYGKVKTLQRQLRSVFGVSAGELRLSVPPDEAWRWCRDVSLKSVVGGRHDLARMIGRRGVKAGAATRRRSRLRYWTASAT